MAANLISFAWGLAEATLFFIVPDVALSLIALKGVGLGLAACVYALAGALCGGAIMFYWGRADIGRMDQILDMIPAIRPWDIEKVRSDLRASGIRAILFGPLLGIPYKIYAAHAHMIASISAFLLISIPARIVRFVLVTLATPYLMNTFFPWAPYQLRVQIVLLLWIIFYSIYFFIKRK